MQWHCDVPELVQLAGVGVTVTITVVVMVTILKAVVSMHKTKNYCCISANCDIIVKHLEHTLKTMYVRCVGEAGQGEEVIIHHSVIPADV